MYTYTERDKERQTERDRERDGEREGVMVRGRHCMCTVDIAAGGRNEEDMCWEI